jgi:2'-5' RNA ligase
VRRPQADIQIQGVDAFGGDRPKTLFARAVPAAPLMELQAAQEHLLRRLGVPMDGRQYTPHVTLARLRSEATARATADWLALRAGTGRISFKAERFVLYSSRDSVGGGPYIVEEAYDLIDA